jgi:hypothetical protein
MEEQKLTGKEIPTLVCIVMITSANTRLLLVGGVDN